MVRPDIVTSWRLALASLAGIGPEPKGWVTRASVGLMIEILSIKYRPSGHAAMCRCDTALYGYKTTRSKVLLNSWTGFHFSPSRQTLESTIDFWEMNTDHSQTSVQEELYIQIIPGFYLNMHEWSLQHGTIWQWERLNDYKGGYSGNVYMYISTPAEV